MKKNAGHQQPQAYLVLLCGEVLMAELGQVERVGPHGNEDVVAKHGASLRDPGIVDHAHRRRVNILASSQDRHVIVLNTTRKGST